jgi:hypothetical protein
VNGEGHGPHAHGVVVSSATDRTPAQMREDSLLWARAGYPATAVGRYRDAADQLERTQQQLFAAQQAVLTEGLARDRAEKRNAVLEAMAHQMAWQGREG